MDAQMAINDLGQSFLGRTALGTEGKIQMRNKVYSLIVIMVNFIHLNDLIK